MEHGGDVYTEGLLKGKELLDFSSNINPLGLPKSFKDNIEEVFKAVERYPDIEYRNVKKSIKEYITFMKVHFRKEESQKPFSEVFKDEDIVLGNGAAEIIDLVISCFKNICIVVPSFVEYEKSALKWGCKITYSKLKEDMSYDYEDIALKMKNADGLIIGNPNNPNGNVIDKSKFNNILKYCEENGKTIIIDEAFIEFTGKRNFTFLEEGENYESIFIIKALTKFYAMPGIRMGYGICKNKKLIEEIKNKQNPWNINCFAETAVNYVLKDKEYIEQSLKWIEEERDFMSKELKSILLIDRVYDTYSNFILFKLKNTNCNTIYNMCLKEGVLIRKCTNFRGLDDSYIRLAIKDRCKNKKMIALLKQIDKYIMQS